MTTLDKQGQVKSEGDRSAPKPKEEIISKEETMFKVGPDGKALPEKFPVELYDRNLDIELLDESVRLLQVLKKRKAINKIMVDLVNKQAEEIKLKQQQLEKETDKIKKLKLEKELLAIKKTHIVGDIDSKMNAEVIEEGVYESREIINQLKTEKEKQLEVKYIELVPCNTGEAVFTFEKLLTLEGNSTPDWVADLISKKVTNPKYTLEEASMLKPNYKLAIKESIMKASGYTLRDYREIMMDMKLAKEKPKQAKKELPNGEKKAPAE